MMDYTTAMEICIIVWGVARIAQIVLNMACEHGRRVKR